jgi:hypothetical protein
MSSLAGKISMRSGIVAAAIHFLVCLFLQLRPPALEGWEWVPVMMLDVPVTIVFAFLGTHFHALRDSGFVWTIQVYVFGSIWWFLLVGTMVRTFNRRTSAARDV